MAHEIQTVAGKVNVEGGKQIVVDNSTTKGFKEGDTIVAFKRGDQVEFKVAYPKDLPADSKKRHVEEGKIIKMHPVDAAIAEKLGKGKVQNNGKIIKKEK